MNYYQEPFFRMQQMPYAAGMPYYMGFPMQQMFTMELEYEQDMERMKSFYPEEARHVQALVEEECDKMEYEGSMMFDEYPDQVMLREICSRIYDEVNRLKPSIASSGTEASSTQKLSCPGCVDKEKELAGQQVYGRPPQGPPMMPPQGPPPMMPPQGPPPMMPPQGPPSGRPQNSGLETLIQVLLFNEMYHRRCRHNRCRTWW